jgi:hypothetical protein
MLMHDHYYYYYPGSRLVYEKIGERVCRVHTHTYYILCVHAHVICTTHIHMYEICMCASVKWNVVYSIEKMIHST